MKVKMNDIRKHNPCKESWVVLKRAVESEEVDLSFILELLGIDDAIWALRALEGKEQETRLFAAYCAESVLPIFEKEYPDDKRPRMAIKAAKDFANGKISKDTLNAAARDAGYAARAATYAAEDATWDAGYSVKTTAAESATWAAKYAAEAATWAAASTVARAAKYAAGAAAGAAKDAGYVTSDAARDAGTTKKEITEELFRKYFC